MIMHRAFTLIETLVAISIVTVAVSGPLVTASRAIVAAEVARDQLIASYLAQEGIEYMHAMRDDAYLAAYSIGDPSTASSRAWNDFFSGDSPSSITPCRSQSCELDPTQIIGVDTDSSPGAESNPNRALHTCESTCAPLYLNASHVYTQVASGNTKTPFTRKLDISQVGSGSEAKVVSKVSWNFHGVPYSVTITDHITAWQ
jgi:prepilin-type N-terminal cleavage/methylation domain-containing protein